MLDFEFAYFFLLYFIFALGLLFRKTSLKSFLFLSVFFSYCIAVLSLTFFPVPLEGVEDFIDAGIESHNNFVPLASVLDILSHNPLHVILTQLLGNIALFVPMGFLLPFFLKGNFKKTLALGVLASLCIELGQLLVSSIIAYTYKITDVDDLILNTLGLLFGYACYRVFRIGFPRPTA